MTPFQEAVITLFSKGVIEKAKKLFKMTKSK